ncbi:MAG TPA: prepilin-type N-terminal cleavage/methylation domain-containing protein [Phycisphaerae bacterium]|nr:prepilin-type N-terminal cleavage/methylation domain-containing protein [Phycisphaerae bacterium]
MSRRPHTSLRPRAMPRPRRGLGLVEVLLCVAIGSMLLTAVAVAFRASFNSYKDSQQRGQMLNSARGCMSRITGDIRMSDAADVYDTTTATYNNEHSEFNALQVPGNTAAGLPSTGGSGVLGITLWKTHADSWDPLASSTNPVRIDYWFDPIQKQVFMKRTFTSSGAVTGPLVICNFVQTFQIYMLPILAPANPQANPPFSGGIVLKRAVINMTLANKDSNGARILADGGQDLTLTFSDSASPRRGQSISPF